MHEERGVHHNLSNLFGSTRVSSSVSKPPHHNRCDTQERWTQAPLLQVHVQLISLGKARDDGRHESVEKPKQELKSSTDARKMTPSVMTALLTASLGWFLSKALRKVVIVVVSKDRAWSGRQADHDMYRGFLPPYPPPPNFSLLASELEAQPTGRVGFATLGQMRVIWADLHPQVEHLQISPWRVKLWLGHELTNTH